MNTPRTNRQTKRALWRLPSRADFSAIVSATQTAGFNEGMTWEPPTSEQDLEEPLARSLDGWHNADNFTWSLDDPDTQALIGRFSIRVEEAASNTWSIGYWVHPLHQSLGYATEGATELVAIGFEELKADKVVASHAKWNTASGRVLLKAGLTLVGESEHGFMKHNQWVAEFDYELTSSDYQRKHKK